MKKIKIIICALLFSLCLFSLCSCTADMNVGNNTVLAEQFMDYLVENESENAFELFENNVTLQEFSGFWDKLNPIVDGAKSYEMKQVGWNINLSNGKTSRTTAYQIDLDNGKKALLQVVTCDGSDGIYGLNLVDTTEFIADTNSFVPIVNLVLKVISIASIGFCIWMIVDCVRRNIKLKWLWIIVICLGVSFSLTLGEKFGISFMLGLFAAFSKIVADPSILSVIATVVIPVGAIVYFFLRKQLTITPNSEANKNGYTTTDSQIESNVETAQTNEEETAQVVTPDKQVESSVNPSQNGEEETSQAVTSDNEEKE